MLNLILKDFKVTKKINIIFFVYSIFMGFVGIKSEAKHPHVLYIMSLILVVYISVLYVNGYDEKYKIHASLNSMPVRKNSIVVAKYLSNIIYLTLYFIGIFISTSLFGIVFDFRQNIISLWDFIICFNIITIFYGVYYPIYYKLEREKLRMFTFGMYMTIFIIPSVLGKFMKSNMGKSFLKTVSQINSVNVIHLMFLVAAVIIAIISIEISIKIYSKKDFI